MSSFLLQLFLYQPVAPVHRLADEAGVVVDGVEIAAAPQHEGLGPGRPSAGSGPARRRRFRGIPRH